MYERIKYMLLINLNCVSKCNGMLCCVFLSMWACQLLPCGHLDNSHRHTCLIMYVYINSYRACPNSHYTCTCYLWSIIHPLVRYQHGVAIIANNLSN